jgi:VRR-NUC domain
MGSPRINSAVVSRYKYHAVSEKEFMAQVIQVAHYTGWLCYHTHDSRRSCPGFPDVILVRGSQLLAAELKTARGKVSPAQQSWIDALRCAGVECHIWRPADFDSIVARLTA